MSPANGHAQRDPTRIWTSGCHPCTWTSSESSGRVKELVAALEVPFDPSQIEWRVMNTTKNGQPMRGQVVPYADQRAYTDRLNALFTPAGWTAQVHDSHQREFRTKPGQEDRGQSPGQL